MWLEYELLTKPDVAGFYCLSTSYRQEPNPVDGRHELIFPMFEFEAPGGFNELLKLESDLCEHLGFKCDHGRAPYDDLAFPGGNYTSMAGRYAATDNELTSYHEGIMYKEFGDVFFLTEFPEYTSPFWNMKIGGTTSNGHKYSNKCDVIMGGMETIGSAERATDIHEMREQFHTISDGGYANLLYDLFGKERVEKELEEFLQHDFVPRFGGGIGVTRMISAMKKAELI